MAKSQDLKSLRSMIAQAKRLIETADVLPEGRTQRASELLGDALMIADHLVKVEPSAAALGQKGGKVTAKRGPEYFRKIAAMRKKRAGGRPPNEN